MVAVAAYLYVVPGHARRRIDGGCEQLRRERRQAARTRLLDIGHIDFAGEAESCLILNLSASPWHVGKPLERRRMYAAHARQHGVPLVFVNQVGGNDELIFDGGSFVAGPSGRIQITLPLFEPALEFVDLEVDLA